jgi:anti-sigma regulatory factor (Ser/Thr protein kinase)
VQRSFKRSYDSLTEIFAFVRDYFVREKIEPDPQFAFCLAVEELFTNMVKYSPGGADEIEIELEKTGNELRLTLNDFNVDEFDLTAAPPPRTDLPLQERRPGGLGLHLVKKFADSVTYEYRNRQSRITVVKRLGQEQC